MQKQKQKQKKKKKSKSKKMTEEEENVSPIQTTSNSMEQGLSSQQRNNLTTKIKIRKSASVSRSNLRPKMKFNGNTQSPQFGLTPPPPLPHPNFHSQLMPSPSQNIGLIQEDSHFHSGDTTAQPLQAVAMTGSYSLAPQIRVTGVQQHMNNTSTQAQSLPRPASMNPQLSGLAQNGQSALIQNTLSQQWLKEMPVMSTPNTPSYRLQQQRQQQALLQSSSSNAQNTSMALNNRQLSQIVQQQQRNPQPMGHPQLIQLQQQYLQLQSQQQQHPLQPQLTSTPQQQLLHHPQQQQSAMVVAPANQKSPCQTGSQPDATGSNTTMPGGSLSPGTEASNHLLGKRRIQDLVSQVDPEGKLDPEVEDLLLEIADNFIDSVTSFACSLAKHRRSSTVESKDVLLHLEKNLGLTIPGFSSEGEKRRKNDICTLMEPSNSDAGSAKEMTRQGGGYSVGVNNHLMRLSTTSEHMISQTFSS